VVGRQSAGIANPLATRQRRKDEAMPATRPIIREPRGTSELMEAAAFSIQERLKPLAPSMHPGMLFTSEGAGVPIKPALGGGAYSPVTNAKMKRP